MRALFGVDPDGARARSIDAAGTVRGGAVVLRVRVRAARAARPLLAVGAHAACRAQARHADLLGDHRAGAQRASAESDILSLLLDAEDEDGNTLSDLQIRDEVMTLLFAGHDTTTSTVSFMFYELARQPQIVDAAARRAGRAAVAAGGRRARS